MKPLPSAQPINLGGLIIRRKKKLVSEPKTNQRIYESTIVAGWLGGVRLFVYSSIRPAEYLATQNHRPCLQSTVRGARGTAPSPSGTPCYKRNSPAHTNHPPY